MEGLTVALKTERLFFLFRAVGQLDIQAMLHVMENPLEIHENMPHHERAWRVKRVAWSVIAIVILCGLFGIFGAGPVAHRIVRANGFEVRYDAIARCNAPCDFKIVVPPGDGDLRLSMNADFLNKVDLERADPTPLQCQLDGDRHTFVFKRSNSKQAGTLFISFRPNTPGRTRAQLEVPALGVLDIELFFLP
jgi:hypothetical protein